MKILLIFTLITFAGGIRIKCDFYHIIEWVLEDLYVCNVMKVDSTKNSTHITSIYGIHDDEYSDEDVNHVKA